MEGPPPAYGSTESDNSHSSVPVSEPSVPPPEPPPTYEPPKEGPYAYAAQPGGGGYYPPPGNQPPYPPGPQGAGYYPPAGAQPIPIQQQPGYGTVHQTVIVRDVGFGPEPRTIECPNCHAVVTTQATYVTGGLTWLSSGLLCLLGCWLGCCLIPFCIPELQDVQHRCPNCQRHIGTYSRL